jgi:hypothetical protein
MVLLKSSFMSSTTRAKFSLSVSWWHRKTYLYKKVLTKVYSLREISIATMASRIAASIMLGGHAAHSKFKI